MAMKLPDEVRVLLARIGALETEIVRIDQKLAQVEKSVDDDERRITKLEQSLDKGRDRLRA